VRMDSPSQVTDREELVEDGRGPGFLTWLVCAKQYGHVANDRASRRLADHNGEADRTLPSTDCLKIQSSHKQNHFPCPINLEGDTLLLEASSSEQDRPGSGIRYYGQR